MMKKTVRWAADIGFRDKVRPAALHASPGDYGLKGPRAQGDLGFNRAITRRVAKKDAADGLPVSEAITRDQWSEREQEVTERAEEVRRGASTWFTASATELRDYARDATPAEIHVDTLREAIKAEETERRHHEHDDASEAEKRHEETVVELEAFKSRHGERIGERTPDIKTNIEQTIAILVAILIAEGFFNALLFKDAQAGGLIGGMVVAFGISAVNVLVGVVTGFLGLRYLNHPEKPMKILGGMVAGAGILMGLFINLFIAHFRDAVEIALQAAQASGSLAGFSMFDIAPGRVVSAMFPNVFGLHSLVAFGLLAIGLTVFAIAVYEGYERITDRYPGYGRVWRKERLAYEARQQVRHGVRDDLSDYFTACRSWFESQQTRHVAAKREIEKALNALELRREKAVAICARAAEQERSQKVAYRQAHRRARNALRESLGEQAACPAYFDEIVTPDLPGFDYTRERDEARAAVTAIEQNITALNITREWLEKHIQEVQEGLSSLEARVHGEIASLREARTESRQSKRKSA
ncbi:MAG: hypothetical protein GVY06_02415 [Alphaproteobacteria bacterium]|jgi:hypothetical protein|nr:hypothetical protein [Alphaproteobacteria bacterium]